MHVVEGMCFGEFATRQKKVSHRKKASTLSKWAPSFYVVLCNICGRVVKNQSWARRPTVGAHFRFFGK